MANIVAAIYNPLIRQNGIYPYFETFLNGLKEAGNNVLCFEKISAETTLNEDIPEEYLSKIKEFKPDLFILFNNQFWDISSHFDVPIIIYDVDSPNVFCNIDKLKKNKRYKYLTLQKAGAKIIQDALEDNEIEVKYIPPFTGVKAENIEQTINIAFCGSHWLWNDFTHIEKFLGKKPTQIEREIAKRVYKDFYEAPFKSLQEFYENYDVSLNNKLDINDKFYLSTRMSGIKRLRYLLDIEDLGLEIRGYFWNNSNATPLKAFPELLLSYSDAVINNSKTTQDFYNSAKIGFNVNHIQAKSGFSWRVCDILASNACLVTEKASDLFDFGFRVPLFESKSEAREHCKKILENENLRKDIVAHSQEIINKNHRFENVLPLIEDFACLTLHSDNGGSLEMVRTSAQIKNAPANKAEFPAIDKKQLSFLNKILYKTSRNIYRAIKLK